MKKIWTLIVCTLMAATLSFAQDEQGSRANQGAKLSIGARGAFDYGIMYGFKEEDDDVDGKPTGIGFEDGAMFRIQMIPNLYFAPEVNIAYVSVSHKYNKMERTYTSTDLEIPLLIRGTVADKFYVTAGPQAVINISNDADIEVPEVKLGDLKFDVDYEEKLEQAKFTFGLTAGFGYNIFAGLFVDARFYMGLMELYPDVAYILDLDSTDDADSYSMINMAGAKMMKIKVGLSYWFI